MRISCLGDYVSWAPSAACLDAGVDWSGSQNSGGNDWTVDKRDAIDECGQA